VSRSFPPGVWTTVSVLVFLAGGELSAQGLSFRRGDTNGDGRFNVSDPIVLLNHIYREEPASLPCRKAADANDDGSIDLSDAIYGLLHLFLGRRPPPAPFPGCGTDPTEDGLSCAVYAGCSITVTIDSPPNLSLTNQTPVEVSGTVSSTARSVKVNGIEAVITGETYTASGVPLVEGVNRLSAVAVDAAGGAATANAQIVLDTTPPVVVITFPPDGAVVYSRTIAVTGAVNDPIRAPVNDAPPSCEVDGIAVPITNNAFAAAAVPLRPGANTIVARVTDQAGNAGTASVRVTYDDRPLQRIEIFAGDGQSARIGSALPTPLVARLLDAADQPVSGQAVVFRVTQSNGAFSNDMRLISVLSDAEGKAAATFTVGTRTGEGCNRVEALAVGFAGRAVFTPTSLGGPPAKINVALGGVQRGAVESPLPEPLSVLVTDAGNNCVSGLPVAFRVVAGGGSFTANGSSTLVVRTDDAGKAAAGFRLGPTPGISNNVVEATIEGIEGLPAVFVATALAPGDPAQTTFSGVVLDTLDRPIPDVLLYVLGTGIQARSSAQGQFLLKGVPAGTIRLMAIGWTTTRPGTWPVLEYDVVTVPGADNSLGMPIYLLPLQEEDDVPLAGGDVDVVLTLPGVPGFELKVLAGSTSFDGVKRPGKVTVTQVHSDKVPMTPADGLQPTMILTIQPPAARFDPPAPITYPNSEGLSPGEITDLYSFDHDLGRFVSIGPGTVSEDGSVITSNPGFGIIKGGWHCAGPARPTGGAQPATAKIDEMSKKQVVCVNQEVSLKATGSPTPGTMEWSGGEMPASATFNTASSTFKTKYTTTGKKTVTATWTCESGEKGRDRTDVTVAEMTLHPNDGDFLAGKVGRVMISTKHDDVYYTTVKTTKADKPAQTADAKVTITAHLLPADECAGKRVYFRMLDPDPDDQSPYEAGNAGGDNRDPTVKKGTLSAASAVAEKKTINGKEVAAAEVELTITSRYSGDNYQVEASLDSSFMPVCARTSILVAWKRIYLEQDNMYQKGATITAAFAMDADANDDVLTVDSTADFAVGNMVTVFSRDNTFNTTVKAKTAATLTVGDLPHNFPKYSGVKLQADNTTYSASTAFLTQAYGADTPGTDGGTFVEFVLGHSGSGNIPKYTSFPSDMEAFDFCNYWFNNSGSKDNIIQLVAAYKHSDGSLGTADDPKNISFITTGNFTYGAGNANAIAFAVTHELGHQFSVANGHVDRRVNARNHDNTDECLMSYNTNFTDNVTEFDIDCLYDVRDAADPR
jgi:hypothetical protein